MERLSLLFCIGLICVASTLATVVDPRGARPVEQGTREEKCASAREWPFCTDDEWGYKCPSGCRIQGLMDKYDHNFLKRIEKIRSLLDQNKARFRTADQVSKQTYDFLKDKLTLDSGSDNTFYDLAQTLRQRITEMKIRIDRQLSVLAALKDRIKDQVVEMQRLEVDIDIKLRSCKGSCLRYTEYQIDKESYVNLDKQINQLDSRPTQYAESVGTLYVMKSRPLQDVIVDSTFKARGSDTKVAGEQKNDMFSEVKIAQLVLEEEGSSSSPATVSKVPVCERLKQQSQDGQKSPSQIQIKRRRECQVKSDMTLCSDDDWVSKCPSGCRLQGLISQMESEVEKNLWKVCKTVKMYEDAADKSMTTTTHIYNSNRKVIVSRHMSELKFVEHAEVLSRILTSVRKRSSRLAQKLKELRSNVQKQLEDLYRTEVDIDIKLRACRGSCKSALPFKPNHSSYQTLRSDMEQMDHALNKGGNVAAPPKNLPHIKVQSADVGAAPSIEQITMTKIQRELLAQFKDMKQNQLVLEEANVEVLTVGELD